MNSQFMNAGCVAAAAVSITSSSSVVSRANANSSVRRALFQGLLFIRSPFSTSVTPAASFAGYDGVEEGEVGRWSCIIPDKDLLLESKTVSSDTTTKTGLYVIDLINSGTIRPDPTLYNRMLKKCTQLGKVGEGRIVHTHLRNSALFRNNLVMHNTVLNMYAKCGCLDDARELFDKMPSKDMVTWTVLITGFSQHDKPLDALVLFPRMLHLGVKPNQFTLSSLLKACGTGSCLWKGMQLHAFCLKYGYHSNVFVGSSLVDMYARYCFMEEAQSAFREVEWKNEVSWNALIAGYARKGEAELAIWFVRRMLREGFQPTHFTYSSIFSSCASTGALEQGKWMHGHLMKSGVQLIAHAGHTLIDMYAKSGSMEDAKKIFNRLVNRNSVSWNSMLTAFAQHGLANECLSWFGEMLRTGVEPNEVTFLCILTACSHAGLLNEGQYYFDLMKKYNIDPGISHYVTFVDLLGRAGHLGKAKKFIREMPIEPTAPVWGALLGACRMHKNIELGIYAAERIFELEPHDSGSHMLLYNIYASSNRWGKAAEVRRMMKESGVKKEPACSWVEIENVVHVFMSNDQSHPQNKDICNMWEKISEKIKEIGYIPDTSNVLMLVDHQEKELRLQLHSEKLALAFALLNTPAGSTICIKKNIRVCSDCHSAIKFVSKVVNREIILRDKIRFHHFRDGSCSCGNYW